MKKENKVPQVSQFSDVGGRVDFMHGYVQFINSLAREEGKPLTSPRPLERHIRKSHAKFYGNDSKYDGKGDEQNLPYSGIAEADKFQMGMKVNYYGVQV